jgi:hypothetical protein
VDKAMARVARIESLGLVMTKTFREWCRSVCFERIDYSGEAGSPSIS